MKKQVLGGALLLVAGLAGAAGMAEDALATGPAAEAIGTAATTYTVLHRFTGPDGSELRAHLIQATDGNFYGTTETGGTFDQGTVFRMTPAGVVTTLHTFGGGSDGTHPRAALYQTKDGLLYGTTSTGGAANLGTVFRLSTAGNAAYVMMHYFSGHTIGDGDMPLSTLMQASDGNLYGMTEYGGAYDRGSVYKLNTTTGAYSVLHSFGAGSDGYMPLFASFIQLPDGQLYSTTSSGGAYGQGMVFKMSTTGTVSVVHAFTSRAGEGGSADSGVVLGNDGFLYGVTEGGGTTDGGVAFKVNPSGTGFQKIHDFATMAQPMGLVQASNGLFYISTYGGGSASGGQALRMTTTGAVTPMHDFVGGTDGYKAQGKPIQGKDGYLYGTTLTGGNVSGGDGTVYRYSMN